MGGFHTVALCYDQSLAVAIRSCLLQFADWKLTPPQRSWPVESFSVASACKLCPSSIGDTVSMTTNRLLATYVEASTGSGDMPTRLRNRATTL